jgi:manganese transport protein
VLAGSICKTKGFRYIEALVITLIATIGGCFTAELVFSKPELTKVLSVSCQADRSSSIRECFTSPWAFLCDVMPHNLYLHSSIVQTRKFEQTPTADGSDQVRDYRFDLRAHVCLVH